MCIRDSDGDFVILPADPHLPQTPFHPQTEPGALQVPLKYQRFIDVSMPMSDFTSAHPFFDPTQISSLRLVITTNGTNVVDVRLGFNDFHFE